MLYAAGFVGFIGFNPFTRSEVIFVKDMLYAVLALISVLVSAGSFYAYIKGGGNTIYFVLAILFLVLTVVLGSLFLSGRVNKNEDIHITE